MDRLFDRFADFKLEEFPATGEWAPSADGSETKDAVMVKAEVPGMDPKDIQISLKNGLLTVTLPKTPAAKGTMIPIKTE
jgi:HSP20 family protein